MERQEIYNKLKKDMPEIEIKQNENMSNHTSFKVGGNADIWIKIKTVEQLIKILNFTKENNIPITILGNGSNVLVKDNGIRGITVQLDFQNIVIEQQKDKVKVFAEAGVKLGMLAAYLQKRGIAGFEFASRNSWNHWRSYSYECRSLWERNEANCQRSNIFARKWNNANGNQ